MRLIAFAVCIWGAWTAGHAAGFDKGVAKAERLVQIRRWAEGA